MLLAGLRHAPPVTAAGASGGRVFAAALSLAVSGGVISTFDPIDSVQLTPEEQRAAVQAAADWGTYLAVHAYTSKAIHRALDAGAKSIEHGHLADEATIRLITEKGAWLATRPA